MSGLKRDGPGLVLNAECGFDARDGRSHEKWGSRKRAVCSILYSVPFPSWAVIGTGILEGHSCGTAEELDFEVDFEANSRVDFESDSRPTCFCC